MDGQHRAIGGACVSHGSYRCARPRRLLWVVLVVCSVLVISSHAKEYTFIAEITPPYTYFDDKQISGIYRDFLDNAFAASEHSYVLRGFNTRHFITAVGNTEFDAVIGVSSYAPYYRVFKISIPIGSSSLPPISLDGMLDELYSASLSAKRVGAVYGLVLIGYSRILTC